jgi:hypothetical protein
VWLGVGLAAVIPLTLGTAWRFRLLSRAPLGLGAATRLILSASTLNLILPSKMGDLAKSVVLARRYGFDGKFALALVSVEKMFDMASLLFWGVLALLWVNNGSVLLMLAALALFGLLALLVLLLSPLSVIPDLVEALAPKLPAKVGRVAAGFGGEWSNVVAWLWSDGRRLGLVIAASLLLWAGHLAQFWLFAQALGHVPFLDNMAFATLSILAGLLPFTMAGIGTRDGAILFFYQPWLEPGQAAVLGVLATTRYLLPALAGVPFMRDFWEKGRGAATR